MFVNIKYIHFSVVCIYLWLLAIWPLKEWRMEVKFEESVIISKLFFFNYKMEYSVLKKNCVIGFVINDPDESSLYLACQRLWYSD